jgi:GT2 family glycosyltransferase
MAHTVSLIIVNYDSGDPFLLACVSSALNQADEVIVVDNASSDDSLAQLEATFPSEQKLLIVRNRENLGFAAGCNIGIDHSSGSCLHHHLAQAILRYVLCPIPRLSKTEFTPRLLAANPLKS